MRDFLRGVALESFSLLITVMPFSAAIGIGQIVIGFSDRVAMGILVGCIIPVGLLQRRFLRWLEKSPAAENGKEKG